MDSKAIALHVAESIDISGCRRAIDKDLLYGDRDELFYSDGESGYLYIFKYGIVSYYGLPDTTVSEIFADIQPFCGEWRRSELTEEIEIEWVSSEQASRVTNSKILLPESNVEGIRFALLHLSQSVALDYFEGLSDQIMNETRLHTNYLEHNGKLDLGGKKLKKYIARVLNINNQISENLYIFDSPEVAWEDEYLDKLDKNLKQIFDLKERYRTIKEQGYIIKENLSLFKDIMDHRESSRLEWIIIILILVEVVDLFIMRIIN
jgi:Uncharacterized conserved protein